MIEHSKTFFSDADKKRIDEAVRKAEEKTSGEIVPVLASRAEGYDRGLFLAALMASLIATMGLFGFFLLPLEFLSETFLAWDIPLWLLLPVQLITLLGGYHMARSSSQIHRAFVAHAYMQQSVNHAAHRTFRLNQLTHTRDATGIMLHVSLFEHMVVVVADKAINEKHDKQTWDKVRDQLVEGIKSGDAVGGFERAIEACGKILEKDFPVKKDDTNELPNHIRLI